MSSKNTFHIAPVREKLVSVNSIFEFSQLSVPRNPARDLQIVLPEEMPVKKKGLSFKEGQARLLHDLANIELQAMELCLRTYFEFPEAPGEFKEQLRDIAFGEAKHLGLALDAMESLGFQWGDWPASLSLWNAVSIEDTLLDRILIVHRYLEGSGLDAGDTLLKKLSGVLEGPAHKVIRIIVEEELGHVQFGSRWYTEICKIEKIDPQEDFSKRLNGLKYKIPKRIENVNRELRKKAGFTDSEVDFLESYRRGNIAPVSKVDIKTTHPVIGNATDPQVGVQASLFQFEPVLDRPLVN